MTITNTIEIAAPVERVWALTVDVEGWPSVTPKTVTSVNRVDGGAIGVGSQARIKQPAQPKLVWTVSEFVPNERFVWGTRTMGISMVGRHEMAPTTTGTRNTLTVELSGRGAGLFARLFGKRIGAAIALENEGFKRAAETG